ncbi:TPA: HypC/HybG/HupF family hydrogenase formation chaperone [Candidatus Poribacteria bacterium]|nr:HypC/HybG/HupF family hydrogenase formation chaperone [Candidatus Poribacteria bacterium]
MCLAIPAKIINITEDMAEVELSGVIREASLVLTPDAKIGDYVLLHAGFAIQVLNEQEAVKLLEDLEFLENISEIS